MDFSKMFKESVGGLKDTAKAQAEFQAMIAGDGGKIVIPDDEDEKRVFFAQIVSKAATTGKGLKDIISLVAGLTRKDGSKLGTKLAGTIVRHGTEAKRDELVLNFLPGIAKLEKTDQKRCITAFWAMKEEVKVNGDLVPLILVAGYKDSLDLYKRGIAIGKAMSKGEVPAETVKEYEQICERMSALATEVKEQRPILKKQLSKFFNVNTDGQGRGRGANIYASISGELSFLD